MRFKRLVVHARKQLHRQQRQAESFGQAAEKTIERNLFRRFSRLKPVRRFLVGWIALFLLLIGCLVAQLNHLSAYYQQVKPVDGGIFTEGIVGSISNVNPIYATSDVDRSLSRLVFAGLLTYNNQNQLVNCLASSYQVSDNGHKYTFKLRPDLKWQDGQPLTSADVLFTYNTIKDPDARSPLQASWQNVTVTAPATDTVVFNLSSTLASFPYNLTTGIIPRHLLAKTSAANLRSADFNTVAPVGAGPFSWHGVDVNSSNQSNVEEQAALVPFSGYVFGKPKLNEFIIRAYTSPKRLAEVYASGQLTAAAGLNSLPEKRPDASQTHSMLLTAGTYVFFKTTSGVLADSKVRQALALASNPGQVIQTLGYQTRPVNEPLLSGQLGYNKSYAQKTADPAPARSLLAQNGWQTDTSAGKPVSFTVLAVDTQEYHHVGDTLMKQWQAIGIKAKITYVTAPDYSTLLSSHDYEATLYGIAIGSDPDVYAYWDSSQADVRSANRLNISEWKNTTADSALEAGRTRLDPQLRTIKYAPFLQAWQQDNPAIGLYQPRFLYITNGQLYGLTGRPINNSVDRYNGVENWQIRTAKVSR